MPGWRLRDKKGCDYPGNDDNAKPPVQLLVLSDHIRDARSGKLAKDVGFDSWDEVFVEVPWARKLTKQQLGRMAHSTETKQQPMPCRKLIYINAYNGDDYQQWSQGGIGTSPTSGCVDNNHRHDATDFSSWQMGEQEKDASSHKHSKTLFETAKIEETAYDTLGDPQGGTDAIAFFRHGVNAALNAVAKAERSGASTFTYLYTAHPDRHMHALGVEHEGVSNVVKGIEREIERLWKVLGDRVGLLSGDYDSDEPTNGEDSIDATVLVTADHGHVTVHPEDMITLPENIIELLEYANVGVHGTGRHGYLHCRSGLQSTLKSRWHSNTVLSEHFLLLTVEEAIECRLFGPECMRLEVRPRLGDFVSISVGRKTLVTPMESDKYNEQCQGAHGSLLPEEMNIPFILLNGY